MHGTLFLVHKKIVGNVLFHSFVFGIRLDKRD